MASGLRILADGVQRHVREIERRERAIDQLATRVRGTLVRRLGAEANRDIRREYNLGRGRVAAGLTVRPYGDGVLLIGRARPIGVIEYGARWSRRQPGVTWQFRRGGGRQLYEKGTFIAVGLSGNRHVFFRDGPRRTMLRGRYAGQLKQPLRVAYEGSIARFLRSDARASRLVVYAQGIVRSEIDRLGLRGRGGR